MFDEAEASASGRILLSETRPMKLYFLRHTEAEDGAVDDSRRLTAKGRRDAGRLGRFFRKTGLKLDLAFTSPLVRARQTATEVLKACPLAGKAKLTEVDALRNGTTPGQFFRWLKTLPDQESVLLVGHEPSLSAWVRQMIGMADTGGLPLSKGTVARVDTENRKSGMLRMLVSPKSIA